MGNPETKRDWGHVSDFVNGFWLSLQSAEPDDYVFATGRCTSLRTFVETAFSVVGIKLR